MFISYAWSSKEYEEKVLGFASRLVSDGIEVLLDKWCVEPGNDTVKFMKKCVNDDSVNYVLMLLDEKYANKADVREVEGVERNPEKMQNVLRSLARNIATQVSTATIEGDVKNNFGFDISRPTITDYLNTLERLFVIENVNATNLNFRSKHAIRTKTKRYFVDPSIATAILEVKPQDLVNDLNLFV